MKTRYILKFSGVLAALFVFTQICHAQLPSEKKIVKPANPFQTSGPNPRTANIPLEQRLPSAQSISPKTPTSMPNSAAFVPHTSTGSDAQKKAKLPSNGDASKLKNMKRPQGTTTPAPVNL